MNRSVFKLEPATAWLKVSGRTLLSGTSDTHGELAPQEVAIVELLAGFFRPGFIGHCNEGEAAGLAGRFVGDDGGFAHLASLTKDFAQVVLGSVEGQVADIEFVIGHFYFEFVSGSSHWLTPVVGLKSLLGKPRLEPQKKLD
jgi:hypothetical protein